jgi:hypothetical protein
MGRAEQSLGYLNGRRSSFFNSNPVPWDETALMRAIVGHFGGGPIVPPPRSPAPGQASQATRSYQVERVKVLLTLGANPSERVHSPSADWTPLAPAVARRDTEVAQALLDHGAPPSDRWCVPLGPRLQPDQLPPAPACLTETGPTPLMLAASLGDTGMIELLVSRGAEP